METTHASCSSTSLYVGHATIEQRPSEPTVFAPQEARMLAIENVILGVGHEAKNEAACIGHTGNVTVGAVGVRPVDVTQGRMCTYCLQVGDVATFSMGHRALNRLVDSGRPYRLWRPTRPRGVEGDPFAYESTLFIGR